MDLDNLFVSDLLDTLVGQTDDRSTTQALGEEGDQPEPASSTQALGEEGEQPEDTWDAEIDPGTIVTSDAVGEEGDQPEDTWDTEPEPLVTTDAVGEDGDQPEPGAPQGIWAGEDGSGGGCVVDEDDREPEPVEDTEWPCEEAEPDVPVECEPADEGQDPATDPGLQCW